MWLELSVHSLPHGHCLISAILPALYCLCSNCLVLPAMYCPQYEQRVVDIVLETKNLPEALAERGEVDISATVSGLATTHFVSSFQLIA